MWFGLVIWIIESLKLCFSLVWLSWMVESLTSHFSIVLFWLSWIMDSLNLCFSLKAHVRAQRKFAQGSRPVSPCVSPRKPKSVATPKKQLLPNVMAKTEDFLTFLCLRGKWGTRRWIKGE